ncbi:agamous-like MADS-box protein AGL62 [Wolffia australiana]
MGRRKIEIKRIENSEARHVTFCKRRTGLFKKLAELCVHCGAEAAALVYSPGGKVHLFAHPDAAHVFSRFLHRRVEAAPPRDRLDPSSSSSSCEEMESILAAEKARRRWWEDAPLDGMPADKLRRLRHNVADLRRAVAAKAAESEPSAAGFLPPCAWPDVFLLDDGGFLQLPPGY